MSDRFDEARKDFAVHIIDETRLVLNGGGNFCDDEGEPENMTPDTDTQERAAALAKQYGMRITSCTGAWYGWSCWTGDPGDVSVFEWERE